MCCRMRMKICLFTKLQVRSPGGKGRVEVVFFFLLKAFKSGAEVEAKSV